MTLVARTPLDLLLKGDDDVQCRACQANFKLKEANWEYYNDIRLLSGSSGFKFYCPECNFNFKTDVEVMS